jgi:hypothetical protein
MITFFDKTRALDHQLSRSSTEKTHSMKIVINVGPAAAGQCPVEDDFMHDFNAFEEPPAGETFVTEHHVFHDLFRRLMCLV